MTSSADLKTHFSDFFAVSTQDLEKAGAFNISLINDLPLSEFIKLADSISDDDMFILGAEMALTDINRGNF